MISLIEGEGQYYPVVPALVTEAGTEMMAVLWQYLLAGLSGMGAAAASVVWEADDWSILKQTVVHFLILSLSFLPVAYFCHWMTHTVTGVATYFLIFIAAYVVIWFALYTYWKKNVRSINDRLDEGKA